MNFSTQPQGDWHHRTFAALDQKNRKGPFEEDIPRRGNLFGAPSVVAPIRDELRSIVHLQRNHAQQEQSNGAGDGWKTGRDNDWRWIVNAMVNKVTCKSLGLDRNLGKYVAVYDKEILGYGDNDLKLQKYWAGILGLETIPDRVVIVRL